MSRRLRNRFGVVSGCAVLLLALAGSTLPALGGRGKGNTNPGVLPPDSSAFGRTYPEWVAAFWQYALSRPIDGHPFLDTPEYDFAAGQSGKVWFWSAPDGPITREVSIPAGTALFLTVRDVESSTLEEAPFFGATEEEQREIANWFADHIVDVYVTIDGVPVKDVQNYRFDSPQFEFDAPTPWIFGNTGGHGTSVADGYYFMLAPMSKGRHVIEYGGTFHFEAGELGDEAFDLPHSGTIILNVGGK